MKRWRDDPQTVRDAATLLPVVAAILLLPPFILVFAEPVRIFGIPLIVVHVFGVWSLTVLGAWLIARRQPRDPGDAAASTDAGRDPGGA